MSITELLQENLALKKRLRELESSITSGSVGTEMDIRFRIEEALADCSRLFAQPGEVDIEYILSLIGIATGAHRACIYEFIDNTLVARNTFEWCAAGIASKMAELKLIDLNMFPWSLSEIVNGRMVNMPDAANLPPEASFESEILLWADIYSMVAVPIFNADNTLSAWMGFVDTSQAHQWQEEDIRLLQVVAEMLGVYWEKKRAEQEILHRLAVEEAIADCSRLLVWDKEVDLHQLLAIIGQAVNVHRVCIYEYIRDDLVECRHEWCAAGTPPLVNELRTWDLSQYSWGVNEAVNAQVVVIEDPEKLPPQAANEKSSIQRSDVKSLLAVPIWDSERNRQALMGYADTHTPRKWQNEDLRCLHVVAEMLGTYWERKRAEEQLLYRLTVEEAIAEASRCFLQTEEPNIYEIIELIGTAVKANRSYLFEINQETGLFDCTYEWCDPTTDSHSDFLKNLDYATVEWWFNQLRILHTKKP